MAQLTLPLREEAPDLVARLRSFGLPPVLPITLHQNRRVMVSFDRQGRFRVHRGYAYAPDPVVLALAGWAKPRIRRDVRRGLARAFLAFPVHAHVPPRRRVSPADPPIDQARLDRLRAIHEALNHRWFAGALTPVRIRLSNRMRRKLGHYEPASEGEPAIVIGRRHLQRDGWVRVADTLLHEMVHQWQDETGVAVDHGPGFRAKAKETGIEPRAIAVRTRLLRVP